MTSSSSSPLYILSDSRERAFDRSLIEIIVNDPVAVTVLDHLTGPNPNVDTVYGALFALFKSRRSHYAPIEGREYVPAQNHAAVNQLIGLHKELAQALVFDHRHVYLHRFPQLTNPAKQASLWKLVKPRNVASSWLL